MCPTLHGGEESSNDFSTAVKLTDNSPQENKDRNLDEGFDRKWKVGTRPHEIKLEDVVLVSLHHVSLGSWQPQLRLRRPRN